MNFRILSIFTLVFTLVSCNEVLKLEKAPLNLFFAPSDSLEDSENLISLEVEKTGIDSPTSCSLDNLVNLTETTACSCNGFTCSVGVSAPANFHGQVSFDYKLSNATETTETVVAQFEVINVDDAPTVSDLFPSNGNEDIEKFVVLAYADLESDLASACSISNLSNLTETTACSCDGAGVCTVGVTGVANYIGAVGFDFNVTANSLTSNTESVSFSLSPTDDAPVANNITPANGVEDVESIITLSYTDLESDLASSCSLSNLSNLTVSTACSCDGLGVCTVGVTGTTNYVGAVSFDYTVTSNSNSSNVASASFSLTGTDDAPITADQTSANVPQNTEKIVVLGYTDLEGDLASSCSVSNLSDASFSISTACSCNGAGTCSVGITAPAAYVGPASFDYTVTANALVSNSSTSSFAYHLTGDPSVTSCDPIFNFDVLEDASTIYSVKLPDNLDVSGFDTTGLNLYDIDFSKAKNFSDNTVTNSSSYRQISFPDGYDVSNINMSGVNIDGIDFSKTVGFSVAQLNSASLIHEIKLPSGFDLTGWNATMRNVTNIDLSDTNITVAQINALQPSGGLRGAKLPPGMDISLLTTFWFTDVDFNGGINLSPSRIEGGVAKGAVLPASLDLSSWDSTGQSIDGYDFSNVSSFTAAHYNNAFGTGRQDMKFPTGMDVSGFNMTGKWITRSDFSNTTGLTIAQINSAAFNYGIKLPSGFDISGWNMSGKYISGTDFSDTTGLTAAQLDSTVYYVSSILPAGFDASALNMSGKIMIGVDFRNTTGLTIAQLNSASNISSVKLPAGFDVSGLTAGANIGGIDFSNTTGLTIGMLNASPSLVGIKFPVGFDVSSLDTTGKSIMGMDFSGTTGLSQAQIDAASDITSVVLPKDFDLATWDSTGKNIRGMDFSNTKTTCDP